MAAAVKNRRWRLLPLTFAFAAGLALILVPITVGISLVAATISKYHAYFYWAGGLLMLALAVFSLSGRMWSMPRFLRAPDTGRGVPWTRSVLPDGRHVVLTAWDRTQPCTTVSQTVIDGFVKTYADPTTGEDWPAPTAPEPGEGGGSDPGAPAAGPPDVSSPAASSPSGGRSP
jgi:hypothetical protein